MVCSMVRFKFFHYFLTALMLLQAVPALARGSSDDPKVENVRVQPAGKIVYIYYDLIGPPQQVYTVSVSLRSRRDSSYQYTPMNISGDIGSNVFSGMDWRVAWDASKEFPKGLKWEDYYFVVNARVYADQLPSGGISTELLVAGGVAVVGGVVALILLNKKDVTPPLQGFPPPPGRP
jgi:hypothetical protein